MYITFILDKEFELSDFVYVTPKQPSSGVKGRLKENIVFWEKIKASSWVLRVIREGYALPFIETPEKCLHKNHRSAVICEDFMKSEITNLLKSGCIKEVLSDNVYIVSPLSVASNNGKKRLILDLRYLNGFLRVQRFQYEDLRTFRDIFSQGDWFFKFDYKSGYHHVDIYPEHWKYQPFVGVQDKGSVTLYLQSSLLGWLPLLSFLLSFKKPYSNTGVTKGYEFFHIWTTGLGVTRHDRRQS